MFGKIRYAQLRPLGTQLECFSYCRLLLPTVLSLPPCNMALTLSICSRCVLLSVDAVSQSASTLPAVLSDGSCCSWWLLAKLAVEIVELLTTAHSTSARALSTLLMSLDSCVGDHARYYKYLFFIHAGALVCIQILDLCGVAAVPLMTITSPCCGTGACMRPCCTLLTWLSGCRPGMTKAAACCRRCWSKWVSLRPSSARNGVSNRFPHSGLVTSDLQ